MSVQVEDRTTLDMFGSPRRGRPRSNPYDRKQQCRQNKRFQRLRDRNKGLRRLELKVEDDVLESLDEVCDSLRLSRSDVVTMALKQWLHI